MRILDKDFSQYLSDHPKSKEFDLYLSDFQEDIKKIIGKFRRNYHALSPEDLASECNIHLLKYKNKILDSFEDPDSDFTQSEFKKIAYHYVKNLVSWSHYKEVNEKYNAKRLDIVHESEDGPKTTFEFAVDTQGEEDNFFELFDSKNGVKNFFHILMNYSYLLTETESKVLSCLRKGMKQDEISEVLGVTRQAISHSFVCLKEKLQAYFDFDEIFEHSIDRISDGHEALNNLLDKQKPKLSEEETLKIKNFVLRYPRQYNPSEISKKLFNDKFTHSQVSGALVRLKLRFLAVKPKVAKENPFKREILELYKKDFSTKEIAEKLKINATRVSAIRGILTKENLLSPASTYRSVFPRPVLNELIKLSGQDLSSESIKDLINKKFKCNFEIESIRIKIGHLRSKKMKNLSS